MTLPTLSKHDFLLHDASCFPLVRLLPERLLPGYAVQWRSEVEALLAAAHPFVLLLQESKAKPGSLGDHKEVILWLKKNRQAFRHMCRGIIGIEPDMMKRGLLHARALVFSPVFGVPTTAAASQDEAKAMATRLLEAPVTLAADMRAFFRAFAANPLQVASIVPSGQALAALMTSEISRDTGPILELGPGTGVFTRAALGRGVYEENLTLVEFDPDFAQLLQLRFPDARVLCMDAQRLTQRHLYAGSPVGAVLSGLPLLSMSPRRVMAILDGAFAYLQPGGNFYQFTYGPRCPVPRQILDRLGLKAVRVGRTLKNVPPATVYRVSQRQSGIVFSGASRSWRWKSPSASGASLPVRDEA